MTRRSGFTLIELMIVVAIVALLAAIAIPNYLTFQCKAKQSQMKSGFGAWFIAEKTFFAEHSTYGTDLVEIHWQPEGAPFYLFGFDAPYPATIPGVTSWDGNRRHTLHPGVVGDPARYDVGKVVHLSDLSPLDPTELPVTACLGDSFILGAVGDIDPGDGLDTWYMDQNRQVFSATNDCL